MPIRVTINGTERKPKSHSLRISTRLNGRAVLVFSHDDVTGTYQPKRGETVELYEVKTDGSQGVKYFGGTIDRISQTARTLAAVQLDIECVDYNELADRFIVGTYTDQVPAKAYKNEAAGSIVLDILNNQSFLFAEGVTAVEVENGPIIAKVIFGQNPYGRYVREAFDYLAMLSNFTWWIDYDRGLHFIARPGAPDAPFALVAAQSNFRRFRLADTREQYANRVWLEFSPDFLSPEVEEFKGDGVAETFPVTLPIGLLVSVTLNGELQTIGLRSDPDVVAHWLWEPGEKEITQGTAAVASSATLTFTGLPANGQTVTINGKVYIFQTTLADVDGNVKIGLDGIDCAGFLRSAINLDAGAGTNYAASMTQHTSVSALNNTPASVTVTSLTAGQELSVAENLNNATWSTPTATILTADDVLIVSYRWLGMNFRLAPGWEAPSEEIKAIQGGSGFYELFVEEPELMDYNSIVERADALLRHYLAVGQSAEFETDLTKEPLAKNLAVGQLLSVELPLHGLIGKQFLVESITASDNGMDLFYFHVNLVGGEFGEDLLRFFERLAERGGGAGTGIAGGTGVRAPEKSIFNVIGTLRVLADATIRPQAAMGGNLRKAFANVKTAPSGAAVQFNIFMRNPEDTAWTSIFRPDELLTIAAGEETGTQSTLATPLPAVKAEARFRVDVAAIGSGEPGKDAFVGVLYG